MLIVGAVANVSLGRVAKFLRDVSPSLANILYPYLIDLQTELLDCFTEESSGEATPDSSSEHVNDIGFGHADFSWSNDTSKGCLTSPRQTFCLHIDNEVVFKKGKFNLIIGPTGSGKTSMLMALLGEMHYIPFGSHSWTNLPREGGISYAAQESWVQNETIKVLSLIIMCTTIW